MARAVRLGVDNLLSVFFGEAIGKGKRHRRTRARSNLAAMTGYHR